MKTVALVFMMAMVVKGAEAFGLTDETVVVYVEGCTTPTVQATAEHIADGMFSEAGVRLVWKTGAPRPGTRGIRVRFVASSGPGDHPGALAYALPYERSRIEVFYDRVRTGDPRLTRIVLAHVLVHEITHILQGIARHSSSGVMKAHWSLDDYKAMLWRPLTFAQDDIDLIRLGRRGR